MIGFSIMMWFVSIMLMIVAVSLLNGNISGIHGKIFDNTEDKAGYGKALGKPLVLTSVGIFLSGIIMLVTKGNMVMLYVLILLLGVIVVAGVWFGLVQRRFSRTIEENAEVQQTKNNRYLCIS